MSTITTRSGKGSPLTNNEVDANFTNLNTDKLESADLAGYAELTGATFTGEVEATGFNGDLTGAILFKGQAGEALTKGDPVYISGISGNKTVVSKADANDSNKMPCFGIVDATVSANADCSVVTFGTLQGLDTSSFSEGDELFISDTGTLTTTAPTGESSQIQKIAKVTRSHASTGSIKVMGAGRTNAVPNLNDGKFFLGNGSNQAVSTDFASSVTAAGALMDSELTAIASVKALNQGVATTDSPTFASINVNGLVTSDDLQIDLGTAVATAQITTPSALSGFQSFIIKNTHTEGYLSFGTTLGQARIQALGSFGAADPLKIDVGSTTAIHIDATGVVRLRQGITENKIDLVGTTTAINLNLATNFVHDLTGNTTYTFSNPAAAGEASAFTLKIIQGSTARTITWPSSVDWAGGTAPTLSTANNAVDVFVFYTIDGGTTYYGFTAGQAFA